MNGKLIFTIFACLVYLSGCKTVTDYIKPKITIEQTVSKAGEIEKTSNPAKKDILKRDLSRKRVVITNVLVKDVIISGNINYNYCVISDINTSSGIIQCQIHSNDTSTMAKLRAGTSRINVSGDYSKFFIFLDNKSMTLEITDAKIDIVQQ